MKNVGHRRFEGSEEGIRIAAVIGSVRDGNYTAKAVALVGDELTRSHPRATLDLVDPRHLSLPGPGTGGPPGDAERIQEQIGKATGVLLATPEYHGSYSSVIKLVIENLGFPSVLAGKPVALLGVAGGRIGAIKALEHLSSVVTHVGGHVLPGFVSVANVQEVFAEDGSCTDPGVEKRVRSVAGNLMDYIYTYLCPRLCMEAMVRA